MTKILVADDSLFIRKMLSDILTNAGYKDLVLASDGVEAFEKYKLERPDLVFLDIIMGEQDGIQTLGKIREIDPNAKVVMITSVGQEEALSKAMKHGIVEYITKPFNEEKIVSVVKKVLG